MVTVETFTPKSGPRQILESCLREAMWWRLLWVLGALPPAPPQSFFCPVTWWCGLKPLSLSPAAVAGHHSHHRHQGPAPAAVNQAMPLRAAVTLAAAVADHPMQRKGPEAPPLDDACCGGALCASPATTVILCIPGPILHALLFSPYTTRCPIVRLGLKQALLL